MTVTRRLVLIVVMTLIVVDPFPAAAEPLAQRPEIAAALQVLDSWITATVATREGPGLAIGIVHDQDVIWSKGYGFADVEHQRPVTSATLFRIASISKSFTATAIMQLRDAGKLRLDEPVTTYLPWFRFKNTHPEGLPITVRHLLTHTSGLPRELAEPLWNDPKPLRRDDALRLLGQAESIYAAETQFKYSNLGYALLGEIVTGVSGEPYGAYIEAHILKPLGMTATLVTPHADTPGLAIGYSLRPPGGTRSPIDFVDLGWLTPAGSLASSVDDLSKFVALQFRNRLAGGAQVLRGSTLREMRRPLWLRADWQSGQGLGFGVRRVDGVVRVGHEGFLPGQASIVTFAPASKLGVIVLTNVAGLAPARVADQVFATLNPLVTRETERARTPAMSSPAWQIYVGTYTGPKWFDDLQIMILDGQLMMVSPGSDTPWADRVVLRPVGADTFRMQGGWAAGELAKFELDTSGHVVRLLAGNLYWTRK
jgi:CubicO group peptidase (beta-lactamase class C family)